MRGDIEESDSQFRAAWLHFAQRLPNGKQADFEGIKAVFCGIPLPFFNVLFLERGLQSEDELARRVRVGTRWADKQGVPWLLCVGNQQLRDLDRAGDVLEASGLYAAMPITGMIADELQPATRKTELELRRVKDAESRRTIVDINSLAYGMPVEERHDLDSERMWDETFFGVVAYADGQPVSGSAAIVIEGSLYVGWVATVPGQRRRGYAETVMRRSLEEAALVHGWRRSVLHATSPGRPVYEKMGYRCAAEYTLYSRHH